MQKRQKKALQNLELPIIFSIFESIFGGNQLP
jgi:hypothetical protein